MADQLVAMENELDVFNITLARQTAEMEVSDDIFSAEAF